MPDREQELRAYYQTLKPVFCPALNETVYFNSNGLNHLLYKSNRRGPRSRAERLNRLELLPYVEEIIANAELIGEQTRRSGRIRMWSIRYEIRDGRKLKNSVKVVVMRVGKGRVQFLSVMGKPKGPR